MEAILAFIWFLVDTIKTMSIDAWAIVGYFVVMGGMIVMWESMLKKHPERRENISDTSSPTDFINIDMGGD